MCGINTVHLCYNYSEATNNKVVITVYARQISI